MEEIGMEELDLNWCGMLTVGNAQQVADLMLMILQRKQYTFVAINELFPNQADVETSLCLKNEGVALGNAIAVSFDEKESPPRFAILRVTYSGGTLTVSTNLREDNFDADFMNPHFSFSGGKIAIRHRTSGGNLITWIMAIEKDDPINRHYQDLKGNYHEILHQGSAGCVLARAWKFE
jgi:hypothetical protein